MVSRGSCFNYNVFGVNARVTERGWCGVGVHHEGSREGPAFIDQVALNADGVSREVYGRPEGTECMPGTEWHTYRIEV